MRRNLLGGFVPHTLLVMLLVGLLGCQGQPSQSAAPTTAAATSAAPGAASVTQPAASSAADTLKVGISAALTGVGPRVGMNLERFVRMSLDDINKSGGVKVGNKTYLFEAVTRDDKLTADGGRAAADYLVLNEKVKFILGTNMASLPGGQAVTEPNKVLSMPTAPGDKAVGPTFPLTIGAGMASPSMRVVAKVGWLQKAHPEVKRIVILDADDASGRDAAAAMQKYAKAAGLPIIGEEWYPPDTKDFGPVVTRVLRQNPDAIDLGTHSSIAPLFTGVTKALYEQGYRGLMLGTSVDFGAWTGGGEATKNFVVTSVTTTDVAAVGAREKELAQRYLQQYNASEFEPIYIPDYNIPLILKQAMEKAGTVDDTVKIVETMRAGEWDTIFGKAKFVGVKTYSLPAMVEQPVYISGIVNGKPTTIDSSKGTLD